MSLESKGKKMRKTFYVLMSLTFSFKLNVIARKLKDKEIVEWYILSVRQLVEIISAFTILL